MRLKNQKKSDSMAKKSEPKEKKDAITKGMTLEQLIKKHPEAVPVLFQHGLHCIGCHIAATETIEQAAEAHGIDLKELLKNLNDAVK
jgi:hybrid cluster-associated redox disulfide protein